MKTVDEAIGEFKEQNFKEMILNSPKDRKDVLSKIPELIGVAGDTDVTYTYKTYPQLFAYRRDTRSISLMKIEEYLHPTFTKALICMRDNGIVEVLYNVGIGKVKDKENGLVKWAVKAELVLKLNDVWEAIRYLENAVIDLALEEVFRNVNSDNTDY